MSKTKKLLNYRGNFLKPLTIIRKEIKLHKYEKCPGVNPGLNYN